ncbi:MAG TPA: monovalent cation/H+ antiporter complex subunit F, partial [Candidatus Binatia bacterium]|nr:monovalent cation/H+ antiporter complex subunit F [Candidatus Binatia bacterium]
LYTEVALVIAILSFLATVAAAKYLLRGTVIDGSAR